MRLLSASSHANSSLSGGHPRQFDAFVHYTLTDSVFLQQNLLPQLESEAGPCRGYRLFLRHRDFPSLQSRSLTEAFDHVVENASRVLVVASSDYLTSDACRSELAILREKLALRKRASNVIVVSLSGDKKRVRQAVGGGAAVLRWNDPSFWQKLRYQMPEASPVSSPGSFMAADIDPKAMIAAQHQHQHQGPPGLHQVGGQFKSEYEDDMWTYVKGMNGGMGMGVGVGNGGVPNAGGRSSNSSGSGSGNGNGQDSSLSTRSTTDNSNATLPLSSASPTSAAGGALLGPRRPLPPTASTLQHHKSANLIVNPMQAGGHTTARGFQQRARGGSTRHQQQQQHTDLDLAQFQLPLGLQHGSDSDYMSVSDSLNRQQQRGDVDAGQRLYQEPIYHTLEPEQAPKSLAGAKSGGKSDSTVYINADLEVVYPKTRPGQQQLQQQQRQFLQPHDDLDDFVDEDEELLAETTTDDDGMFDLSRSRNGSYVPSPAPGSFPRKGMAMAAAPAPAQRPGSARRPPQHPQQRKLQQQQQQHAQAQAHNSQSNQSAYYI